MRGATPGNPTGDPTGGATGRRAARPRRRTRRRVLLVVLAVLVVVLALAGWLAWRGLQVVDALEQIRPAVVSLQDDLAAGDVEQATTALGPLQEQSARATAATGDPVWRAASHLPWVGAQLGAVTDVVAAVDLLATDVVPVLAEVAGSIDPESLAPVDGTVDLAPLAAAAPQLQQASEAATRAQGLVDAIDTAGLVEPLADAVEEARTSLRGATSTLEVASTAATLVPPMLGAEGARTYLLLVLNPAELRSTGGIVASVALLTADGGSMSLNRQVAAGDLPQFESAVLPLTADEEAVHTRQLGRLMQNVTMTPDFPRTAELAVELWARTGGEPVDGVLATDPVTLSYVLGATGPVESPDGTVLDEQGAVRTLLYDAYERFPESRDADAFFAGAAASVFDAISSGQGDARALVPALVQAASERRVAVWSAHPDEQGLIGGTTVGGAFLSGAADERAGVFLDDGTGTKLDYFLGTGVEVLSVTCPADGAPATAVLSIDLTSQVPADPSTVPSYMTWNGSEGPPSGALQTNVTVYAPVGGGLGEVREVHDGTAVVGAWRGQEAGRDVVVVTSRLDPGGAERYEVDVTLPTDQEGLAVWSTPTLAGPGAVPAASCS